MYVFIFTACVYLSGICFGAVNDKVNKDGDMGRWALMCPCSTFDETDTERQNGASKDDGDDYDDVDIAVMLFQVALVKHWVC